MATFCQNAEEISGVINYVVSNRIQDKHKQLANERKMTRSKKAWKPRLMIFYREAFLVPIIYMRDGKIALNLKNFLKCILSGVKTTAPLSPPPNAVLFNIILLFLRPGYPGGGVGVKECLTFGSSPEERGRLILLNELHDLASEIQLTRSKLKVFSQNNYRK